MTLLDRIEKLERELARSRLINSEHISISRTGKSIQLLLEDPYIEADEGDSYEGYFKVVDVSDANGQKVAVIDGAYADDPDNAPDTAGYAVINDVDMGVPKKVLAISEDTYIYAEFEAVVDTEGKPTGLKDPEIKQSAERPTPEDNKFKKLLSIVDWDSTAGTISRERQQHYGMIHGYIFKTCAEAADGSLSNSSSSSAGGV